MEAFPSGLYHLSHTGSISWHGFAEAIFAAARERGEELVVQQVEAIPPRNIPPLRRARSIHV